MTATSPLRIAIIGTTDLTRVVFDAVADLGMSIVAVVTGPETFPISYERKGVRNYRHANLSDLAAQKGIPCHIFEGDTGEMNATLQRSGANLAIVCGWYHIVSKSTRSLFSRGCVGLHASLLPRFRGGAPLNWAMLAGQSETGISLFEFDENVDEGPIYAQAAFPVLKEDYIGDLIGRCEGAAAELIRTSLPRIEDGSLRPAPQRGAPTYGLQRRPSDSAIDWRQASSRIERLVRASSRPYAGAYTHMDQAKISVWRAHAVEAGTLPVIYGQPGQIALVPAYSHPVVLCGDGFLALEEISNSEGVDMTPELRRWGHRRFAVTSS
jgi:methionyl-tRNA formyltransferase